MSTLRFPPRSKAPGGLSDITDSKAAKDRIVQQTDQDASQSRLSAVETGYLEDAFVKAFAGEKGQRRFPLINRGTYVRSTAIDSLVIRFLETSSSSQKKQIVSLGAGSDTRFFRLRQRYGSATTSLVYHEFDFPEVTRAKVAAIMRDELGTLLASIGDADMQVDREAGSLYSEHYRIHPLDIRSLQPGVSLPNGVDRRLPTLFLSECCLIYLAPEEADNILKWASKDFTSSVGFILYEPIGGDDAFGKVMIQNLAARGIVLKTLKRYSSLERQKERLRMLGFTTEFCAADVDFIHDHWVPEAERERIARLEMLDEVEEWQLLARHYCIAWGWREAADAEDGGPPFVGWRNAFPLQE